MSATTTRPTQAGEQPVKPVDTSADAGKVEAKGDVDAEVKTDLKVEGKAKGKEEKGKDTDPATSHLLTRPYASEWVDPDKYHAEFFIGEAWSNLNNGNKITSDHKGLSLGLDLRLKFPFGKNNAFYGSAGLRYQRNHQTFDLNPGESHLNSNKIGLTGGIHWRAVPEWLTLGAEVFLGPDILRSSCNKDEEGFCDGESGTVYNLNAQAYPVSTTGFYTGAGLRIGIWRDILNFRVGGGKTWGGSGDIETATQGSFSQPFSPGEFTVQAGINFAPLFSKKTWHGSTYSSKKRAEVEKVAAEAPEKTDAAKTPEKAKPDAAKPEGPKPATAEQLATQFAGHKSNIEASRDRAKTIYETDLKDTRRAPASVFGGEEKKREKMQALVEEAKTKGSFAQLEYRSAKELLVKWEETVSKMSAGKEQDEARAKLEEARAEFAVKKDGQESVMELNHSAYVYSKRSVDYFNDYAKKTKGVDKVDFDLDQPEGYVVKSKRPSSSKPKKKPEAKKPAKTEPKKGEKKPEKKDPEPSVPAIDIGEPGK